MNILLVNKYNYVTGGPEKYMFSVAKLLEQNGHTVTLLTMESSKSEASRYKQYFLPAPYSSDGDHYEDSRISIFSKISLFLRSIYYFKAKALVKDIVKNENISTVVTLNICNYISPSVIDGAKKAGAKVIVRYSDFNFACASYHFLRDGKECTLCMDNMKNAIKYKCAKGSRPLSILRVIAMKTHRFLNIWERADAFIAPSKHMQTILNQYFHKNNNIKYIPSFVDFDKYSNIEECDNYILYFGRLSEEKGVRTLLEAWIKIDSDEFSLRLVGEGSLEDELKSIVKNKNLNNVKFLPFLSEEELMPIIKNCAIVVIPSICHDNSPMAAYEAMAYSKPIIASYTGGLRDQVVHGETGLHIDAGDSEALANAIKDLCLNQSKAKKFGCEGRKRLEQLYSSELHYQKLQAVL